MKLKFKNVVLALTLGVVTAGTFTFSKSQHSGLGSNTTLSENAAIASIAAEEAEGTCCPSSGLCIVGRFTITNAYLLAEKGKPCP